MDAKTGDISGGCPFTGHNETRALLGRQNRDWWPDSLNLEILTQAASAPIRWATISIMPKRSMRSITPR